MRFAKIFAILILLASTVEARWATDKDASFDVEFFNVDITVNKDGTWEEIRESQEIILKEDARYSATNCELIYNGNSEELVIIEAKTIVENKTYLINKDKMEDKPLASSHQGFDQQRQVLLTFPNATIGAKIYLKYQIKHKKIALENVFGNLFDFGSGGYIRNTVIKIRSALPLHLQVNDPLQCLKITEEEKDNFYYKEIALIKPISTDVINEPGSGVLNPIKKVWVVVSSLEKWEELGTRLGSKYNLVINQELPNVLNDIVKLAVKQKDEAAMINSVTSELNKKFHYMGDWRSIEGGYFPRNLAIIVNSQIGDCKDFSVMTAAILKKLGFKAQIAFVMRGNAYLPYPFRLPILGNFNHVIVKVTNNKGKIYWVDPTNFISMADGIYADIADRMALIFDQDKPSYEKIPNIDPKHARREIEHEFNISKNDDIITETSIAKLKGEEAAFLTGIALTISEQDLIEKMFYWVSGKHLSSQNKKYMHLPRLDSRIVKDLTISYSFNQENMSFKTNSGEALKLEYDWLYSFIDVADDQVSDIFVSNPISLRQHIIVKNAEIKNIENLNITISKPWLYASRKCYPHPQGIEIIEEITIPQSFISNADLKTQEYKEFKKELENNFNKVAIVFLREYVYLNRK